MRCSFSRRCGNAPYVGSYPSMTWNNASAQWNLMPAMACPAVCGYQTFTLQAGSDATGIT